MKRKIDYKTEYAKQFKENCSETIKELHSSKMPQRIVSAYEKMKIQNPALTIDEFVKKFDNDPDFIALIAKDPIKQSFHEKLAGKFIETMVYVKCFKILVKSGKNALYCENGEIVEGTNKKKKKYLTKSLDFSWEIETLRKTVIKFYGTHKFTKESGGNQDNQFADVINSMQHFCQNQNPHRRFLAILDGPYYQESFLEHKSRIEYLNKTYGNEYCRALCINDLEDYIKEIYIKY